ncbi:hypothetical protein, conserved [Entamoeba dispar SAW760]|uniref:Endoglucanase n=1 Tax=Entamoeba dispar (strain ATCC PRA-260 / SAW760) TaxID=370354 RepID=B0E5Q7_ENTDS|nr:uncharacterized protein EDI_013730 [Entamoeba dispar SAW760]EDR30153.1 hypothetical protein, conserved [Entamoeba dispar SAW760]|eukprot:EDR30153.1 hypothetical protein, conserved [Entamoeba dispar SAW760]
MEEVQLKEVTNLPSVVGIQEHQIYKNGRVLVKDGHVIFDFCNTGILFKTIQQTLLLIHLTGFVRLKIRVGDSIVTQVISMSPFESKYTTLELPGNKVIQLTKVTEARSSKVDIVGIITGSIEAIHKEKLPRIEFIGDSLTCGYGNIGYNSEFETDSSQTWCVDIANYLHSDYMTTSWSGIGVLKSNHNVTANQLPIIIHRCIATDETSHWNIGDWNANYVFLNIGTNDYAIEAGSAFDLNFKNAMKELIQLYFNEYGPNLLFFIVEGPIISGHGKEYIKEISLEFVYTMKNVFYIEAFIDKNNPLFWGFKNHPSVEGHHQMSRQIIPQLETILHKL